MRDRERMEERMERWGKGRARRERERKVRKRDGAWMEREGETE